MEKRERVLVIHQEEDLRTYTSAILSELGFRHVLTAPDLTHARQVCQNASDKSHPIQLIVSDDNMPEGTLNARRELGSLPFVVVTDSANPNNTRLAAALGVSRILFRPFGKSQMEKVLIGIQLK